MTRYHVLRANGGNDTFDVVATDIQAASADGAIRTYATAKAPSGAATHAAGTFVAVPSRSWKPTVVKVETQTVIRVGGAA